jgi:hypothetical protein
MQKESEIFSRRDTYFLDKELNYNEILTVVEKTLENYSFDSYLEGGRTELSPPKRIKVELKATSKKSPYNNIEIFLKMTSSSTEDGKTRFEVEYSAKLITKLPKDIFGSGKKRESFYSAILNIIEKFQKKEAFNYNLFARNIILDISNCIRSYLGLPGEISKLEKPKGV